MHIKNLQIKSEYKGLILSPMNSRNIVLVTDNKNIIKHHVIQVSDNTFVDTHVLTTEETKLSRSGQKCYCSGGEQMMPPLVLEDHTHFNKSSICLDKANQRAVFEFEFKLKCSNSGLVRIQLLGKHRLC